MCARKENRVYTNLLTLPTLLGGGEEEAETRQANFAESSTESRSMLLRRSLELTAWNPILGVGIGQFNVAVADAMKDEGQRGHYLQTHNMYTQVSSETGLPGFLLYMAALWYAIGGLRVVRKQAGVLNPDLAAMASCLQGAWIVFLTSSAFASVAYHLQVIMLFGFSYALRHALASEQVAAAARRRSATHSVAERGVMASRGVLMVAQSGSSK